ncbi:hypothetical protein EDD86DRAFT_247840 [Gorgonomyces haynaldii]|nr:hypothetical protein EDD86DRAFT_247840 [Gorgonomyces haynaldii]
MHIRTFSTPALKQRIIDRSTWTYYATVDKVDPMMQYANQLKHRIRPHHLNTLNTKYREWPLSEQSRMMYVLQRAGVKATELFDSAKILENGSPLDVQLALSTLSHLRLLTPSMASIAAENIVRNNIFQSLDAEGLKSFSSSLVVLGKCDPRVVTLFENELLQRNAVQGWSMDTIVGFMGYISFGSFPFKPMDQMIHMIDAQINTLEPHHAASLLVSFSRLGNREMAQKLSKQLSGNLGKLRGKLLGFVVNAVKKMRLKPTLLLEAQELFQKGQLPMDNLKLPVLLNALDGFVDDAQIEQTVERLKSELEHLDEQQMALLINSLAKMKTRSAVVPNVLQTLETKFKLEATKPQNLALLANAISVLDPTHPVMHSIIRAASTKVEQLSFHELSLCLNAFSKVQPLPSLFFEEASECITTIPTDNNLQNISLVFNGLGFAVDKSERALLRLCDHLEPLVNQMNEQQAAMILNTCSKSPRLRIHRASSKILDHLETIKPQQPQNIAKILNFIGSCEPLGHIDWCLDLCRGRLKDFGSRHLAMTLNTLRKMEPLPRDLFEEALTVLDDLDPDLQAIPMIVNALGDMPQVPARDILKVCDKIKHHIKDLSDQNLALLLGSICKIKGIDTRPIYEEAVKTILSSKSPFTRESSDQAIAITLNALHFNLNMCVDAMLHLSQLLRGRCSQMNALHFSLCFYALSYLKQPPLDLFEEGKLLKDTFTDCPEVERSRIQKAFERNISDPARHEKILSYVWDHFQDLQESDRMMEHSDLRVQSLGLRIYGLYLSKFQHLLESNLLLHQSMSYCLDGPSELVFAALESIRSITVYQSGSKHILELDLFPKLLKAFDSDNVIQASGKLLHQLIHRAFSHQHKSNPDYCIYWMLVVYGLYDTLASMAQQEEKQWSLLGLLQQISQSEHFSTFFHASGLHKTLVSLFDGHLGSLAFDLIVKSKPLEDFKMEFQSQEGKLRMQVVNALVLPNASDLIFDTLSKTQKLHLDIYPHMLQMFAQSDSKWKELWIQMLLQSRSESLTLLTGIYVSHLWTLEQQDLSQILLVCQRHLKAPGNKRSVYQLLKILETHKMDLDQFYKQELLSSEWENIVGCLDHLQSLDSSIVPDLELLEHENMFVRASCARLLANKGYKVPPERVLRALHDSEACVRMEAIQLARFCDKQTILDLVLQDPDIEVRMGSISLLKNDTASKVWIQRFLEDDSRIVRQRMLQKLLEWQSSDYPNLQQLIQELEPDHIKT